MQWKLKDSILHRIRTTELESLIKQVELQCLVPLSASTPFPFSGHETAIEERHDIEWLIGGQSKLVSEFKESTPRCSRCSRSGQIQEFSVYRV